MKPEALNGTVLGTCTLQHIIHRDGMGIVYLAQQANPQRQVAVTVLSLAPTANGEQRRLFLERYRREMKVVATLTHPSIVPVYDYGDRDEMAYVAQPYYHNGTLNDVLTREGWLAWPGIMTYLEQIAAALDYAHEHGVLHQNISPASMLLTAEGNLLVSDFGLVSILMEGLTPQERLLGTAGPTLLPDYMAPEQLTGEPVDGRADIYSLGVLLYQMVTGKTPFQGETPIYIAAQQVQVSPPSPRSLRPDLPVAAEQALLRAMEKQAANRYARAQEFASAFRAALIATGIALPAVAVQPGSNELRSGSNELRSGSNELQPLQPALSAQDTPLPVSQAAALTEARSGRSLVPRTRSLFNSVNATWGVSTNAQQPQNVQNSQTQDILAAPSTLNAPATPFSSIAAQPKDGMSSIAPVTSEQGRPQSTPTVAKAASDEVSSQPTGNIPLWSTRLRNNQKTSLSRPGGMGTIPATPSNGLLSSARPAPVTDAQMGPSAGMMGTIGAMGTNGAEIGKQPEKPVADKPAMPQKLPPLATHDVTRALPEMQQTMTGVTETTGTTDGFGTIGAAGTRPLTTRSLNPLSPLPPMGITGALHATGGEAGNTGTTTTIKLTDAVKVVQVPVAGQPGRYMTGFLPVLGAAEPVQEQKPLEKLLTTFKTDSKQRLKMIGIVALVALVLFSSIAALLIHARSGATKQVTQHIVATPNYMATTVAQATATADANIILQDPLTENIHNWPDTKTGTKLYFFSSDGYHIADNDSLQSAPAILPGEVIAGPMAYSLTMKEIKGNDGSLSNTFGMILRFSNYKKGNQMVTTFYVFEVLNMKGGQYQFWRYDSSQANHWISIWKHNFGGEFHQGHGSGSVNTVRIFASGKSFSFTVNGKGVGNAQDSAIASGEIGMLVNLQGTEVAFSNLSLTHS